MILVAAATTAGAFRPTGAAASEPSDERVTVRGAKDTARRESSVASSVVPRAELEAPGLRAADVLRTQPGVQIADSGGLGAPATALVRGATGSHTPLYLGGIRVNDDVAGVSDVSLVPVWFLHRIEIYRGHAPIEADRLGMGGAIFFEPRRPTKTELSLGVTAGSFRTQGAWLRGGVAGKDASVLAGVSVDASANDYTYRDDGGTLLVDHETVVRRRTNADARIVDAWALGTARLGVAQVSALLNAFDKEQGVPRLAILPSREARVRMRRTLFGLEVTAPTPGGHVLEAHAAVLAANARYDDPLGELYLRARQVDLEGERIEQSLGARLYTSGGLLVRPVVNLAHETLRRAEDGDEALRARRIFGRVALSARWPVAPHLVVHGLAAGECHGTAAGGAASACDYAAPTGRVGVESPLGPVTLMGTLGRYVRVPTLGELFGVSEVVRGNAELRPEAAWSAELGARVHGAGAGFLREPSVEAFAFARWADDLVSYRRAGMGYVVPVNVQSARILGAELALGTGLGRFVHASVSATFLDPRDTSGARTTTNDVLPYRARLVLAPSLRARSPRLSTFGAWLTGVSAGATYVYQSSRFADPAGLAVVPEQGSLDLDASADLASSHLRLRVRVANVLDQTRTDIVGFPLPGRSVFVSLESTL